ncbi:MAG TPA: hypothetical protein VI076_01125, partial [Actinopolymorphaceae bacterium]
MREFRADEATVARLCARFGLGSQGGRLTPAAEGAMGRIWRMDLDDGRRYAVKELFWEWEESAAVRECDFATLSGVRTPRFFRTIDGTLFDRLPSTLGGAVVRLFSWVDGRETLPGDPGRSRWFGDALGRLHTLDLSPQGWSSHPWYDTCSPPERWKEL